MAVAAFAFEVTDLVGEPVSGRIRIDLTPHEGSGGGAPMRIDVETEGRRKFTVREIACRPGPGTIYLVRLHSKGFKPYAFFQTLKEGSKNLPSESPIRLAVDARKVKDITAPPFSKLPVAFRRGLDDAKMRALAPEDEDLVGLAGAELYDALGPLRKACLLNLVAKATHPSADRVSRFVRAPMVLRQDRCFVEVDPAMHDALCKSERFKSAPGALHEAPEGFERMDSFKSKDAHANLQVTFMRNLSSGVFWADVDIDEAAGVEHGFEVIRNSVTKGRTNPFLVRELLLLADPLELTLDPGYRFVFG
jgi:hypothetical protein